MSISITPGPYGPTQVVVEYGSYTCSIWACWQREWIALIAQNNRICPHDSSVSAYGCPFKSYAKEEGVLFGVGGLSPPDGSPMALFITTLIIIYLVVNRIVKNKPIV